MPARAPKFSLQLQNSAKQQPIANYVDLTGLIATVLLLISLILSFLPTNIHQITLMQFGATGPDFDSFFYFILGISFLFYLLYSFATETIIYLWNLDHVESVVRYFERIKSTPAVFEFSCVCYHFETRIRYVTRTHTEYITVDGKTVSVSRTQQEPETYQERVNTYSETRNFPYSRCVDMSPPLTETIRQYQAVRVKCEYHIFFGNSATRANYEASKARFISENRNRDVNFEFHEKHYIDGFKSQLLSIVDLSRKPVLMHWAAYVILIFLLLSWPYRLWFHAQTAQGHLEFRKYLYS